MSSDEGVLPAELLGRLATQMRLPLAPERAAALCERVQGMLVFTGELDQVAMDDAAPATVFSPLDD